MKQLIVFGTKPEAIKMAPLVKELQKSITLVVKFCVAAQHRQILHQVLQLFAMETHYDLDLEERDSAHHRTKDKYSLNQRRQRLEGTLASYG